MSLSDFLGSNFAAANPIDNSCSFLQLLLSYGFNVHYAFLLILPRTCDCFILRPLKSYGYQGPFSRLHTVTLEITNLGNYFAVKDYTYIYAEPGAMG